MASPVLPFRTLTSTNSPTSGDDDLRTIVQKMINAGESEANIAAVIKAKTASSPVNQVPANQPRYIKPTPTENPDNAWWKGIGNSLTSGQVNDAGLQGGLGWLKGATLDLPGNILDTGEDVAELIAHPINKSRELKTSFKSLPGNIVKTFEQAGSNPEAFGELAGQIGGQPLMLNVGPGILGAALPSVGTGMQTVGDFIAKNQPITGMVPPIAMPRTLRMLEKYSGYGLSALGDKLSDTVSSDEFTKPKIPNPTKFANQPLDDESNTSSQNTVNLPPLTGPMGRDWGSPGGLPSNAWPESTPAPHIPIDLSGKPQLQPIDNIDIMKQWDMKSGNTPYGQQSTDEFNPSQPSDLSKLQAKAVAIQKNVNNKYGPDGQPSDTTAKTLSDTKNKIPVINRPGTYIRLKNPTFENVKQAQMLGYQFDSEGTDGSWRMVQTGQPLIIR